MEIQFFGSHELGKHCSGYAQIALHKFGAVFGQGEGHQGHSYGIPTIDKNGQALSIEVIKDYVKKFKQYAEKNKATIFYMTKVGCGYANHKIKDIAPLFKDTSDNVIFPFDFIEFLEDMEEVSYADLNEVWKDDFPYITLPSLEPEEFFRIKLKKNQLLASKKNIWELFSSKEGKKKFVKLEPKQFENLSCLIEEYEKNWGRSS